MTGDWIGDLGILSINAYPTSSIDIVLIIYRKGNESIYTDVC